MTNHHVKTIPLRIRKFNQAKCVQNLPKHTKKKDCTNHAIAIPSNNTPNVGRIPAVVTTCHHCFCLRGSRRYGSGTSKWWSADNKMRMPVAHVEIDVVIVDTLIPMMAWVLYQDEKQGISRCHRNSSASCRLVDEHHVCMIVPMSWWHPKKWFFSGQAA